MLEMMRQPFMQTALIGGAVTACLCAYVGVFVILKRIVFMGIALAEVAALGVALGLFIGVHPVLMAFGLTCIAIVLLWMPFAERCVSRESLLGFVYAAAAALAFIFLAKNPLAESHGVNLVSGNLLYMTWPDIAVLGLSALVIIALHAAFFKEFMFVSLDRETAAASGISAGALDLLLYITIGISVSVAMRFCGIIYVFASLIIPPMIGLVTARRIGAVFAVALVAALISVVTGLFISYTADLPSGPAIVTIYTLIFIVAFAVRRGR